MIAEAARTWTDEVPIDYLLRTLLREGRTAEIVKLTMPVSHPGS